MREALKARQSNMDAVNATHGAMAMESGQMRVAAPDYVQEKVNHLNADWAQILYLSANLRPASDSSVEALIEREQQYAVRAAPPMQRSQPQKSAAPSGQLEEFELSLVQLHDWLTLLERMLVTETVVVDDIPDIEGARKRQQ
ncbi:PREDICTED: uncharacterized protein LOC106819783, partial [Priapulus caudatus]|uniref:Uncharacterized protein LOC106819783 n=1 Tax=Priapulus caudatus TaxID=37621 RepID=A0ABM1F5Y3_PRICU